MTPDSRLTSRRRNERRGHRGEWLASFALTLKGYRILERRYRTRHGEIDLIARRGNVVAFVEVKVRSSLVEAMDAVSYSTERRIEAAADAWFSRQKDHANLSLRYDLIAILPWRWPVHVENVFHGRN